MGWFDKILAPPPKPSPTVILPAMTEGDIRAAGRRMLPKVTTIVAVDEKGKIVETPLKADDVMRLFDEVQNDPLAGQGSLSKREIFVDKLFAKIKTSSSVQSKAANGGPLLEEPVTSKPATGARPGDKAA